MAVIHPDPLQLGLHCRLESVQHCGDVPQGRVGHLLAEQSPVGGRADEHDTAVAVQKST